MISTFIVERCSDLPVSTCCRVLKVSTSGHYQRVREPVTDAELVEAYPLVSIEDPLDEDDWEMPVPPSAGAEAEVPQA